MVKKIEYKKIMLYFLIFTGIIMVVVLIIGSLVIGNFKKSEAYKAAINDVYSNTQVQIEAGEIRSIGYLVGGELKETSAEITFTVHGAKKDLNVYYELSRSSEGHWVVDKLSY